MPDQKARSRAAKLVLLLAVLLPGACDEPSRRRVATGTESVELVMLPPYKPERFTCPTCRIETGAVVDVGEGIYGPYRIPTSSSR